MTRPSPTRPGRDALRQAGAALAAAVAAPAGLVALAVRPEWRAGLGQRLGWLPATGDGVRPAVWIHGASVGEARVVGLLGRRLLEQGLALRASATSVAGRSRLRDELPGVPCSLAPLDHPWCVDRALRDAAPAALVLVETELWPCWIAAAARAGVPVGLVSGRLSRRAFARYRALRPLVAPTLARLAAVGARTPDDAARFRALGAPAQRVRVTGDLKLDLPTEAPPLPGDLVPVLKDAGPCLVAGSTHPGEEEAVGRAVALLRARGVPVRAVVAPRRVERCGAAEAALRRAGCRVRRRSRPGAAALAPGEVLVVDRLGELPALYRAASVAFVGGSLAPVGGHSLAEPLVAGAPVLHGPHVEDVGTVAEELAAVGAARSVGDASSLAEAFRVFAADAPGRAARGVAALAAHRGSLERSAELVGALVARAGAP